MRIGCGDRVKWIGSPHAPPTRPKGTTGTAGVIVLSPYVERWNLAWIAWDDGTVTQEVTGHLARVVTRKVRNNSDQITTQRH